MLIFAEPTIGARAYIAKGPSNWMETFPRRLADEAMKKLLGTIAPLLAVEGFVRAHRGGKQRPTWVMVVEYLSGLCQIPQEAMDPGAVIAFWAAVLLQLDESTAN
jgi:hypothetical protein